MTYGYEKSTGSNTHKIESNNVICESDTGRVVAVFYHEHDLEDILNQLPKYSEFELLGRICKASEVIVRDYWKYINEDVAKEELKNAVYDYKGWLEKRSN